MDDIEQFVMKLEWFPIEPWMKAPENIIFDVTDEVRRRVGDIALLWGKAEAYFKMVYHEEMKAAGNQKPYKMNTIGRVQLILKIIKLIKTRNISEDVTILQIAAKSIDVIKTVRHCLCHRNFVGMLVKPKGAMLYDGYNDKLELKTYVLTDEMVHATYWALRLITDYLALYGNMNYPGNELEKS